MKQTKMNLTALNNLDKVGITCSSACAIHCLLLPIIAFTFPVLSNSLHSEWVHLGLLITLIPTALVSFTKSIKIHSRYTPITLGTIGVSLLTSAIAVEMLQIKISYLEKTLTGIGSLLLITAHIYNMIYLRKETSCSSGCC